MCKRIRKLFNRSFSLTAIICFFLSSNFASGSEGVAEKQHWKTLADKAVDEIKAGVASGEKRHFQSLKKRTGGPHFDKAEEFYKQSLLMMTNKEMYKCDAAIVLSQYGWFLYRMYIDTKLKEHGLQMLNEAVNLCPTNANIQCKLAFFMLDKYTSTKEQKYLHEAESILNKVVQIDSKYYAAYFGFYRVYITLGDTNKAISMLNIFINNIDQADIEIWLYDKDTIQAFKQAHNIK